MIVLDKDIFFTDFDLFLKELDQVVSDESENAIRLLAEEGVETMRDLEHSVHHDQLAELWGYTVTRTSDGAEGEIKSEAEDMDFYDKSFKNGERVRNNLYHVDGAGLLAMLEDGTKEHWITAGTKSNAKKLAYPGGEKGAREFMQRYGPNGSIVEWPEYGENVAYAETVDQLGFQGNHNLETTRLALELAVTDVAAIAEQNIEAKF